MSHRAVDVEIADEEGFLELLEYSDNSISKLQQKNAAVKQQLSLYLITFTNNSNNTLQAIQLSLQTPTTSNDPQEFQELNTQIIVDAISSAKASDIQSLVNSLTTEQVDVLFKYIYKAMAFPELFNSAILLMWHEKVLQVGNIMRVLTDRRRV